MDENKSLCPACGADMELKLKNFTIGLDGGGGLLSGLWHEQYEVDLYACPRCGKVELCSSEFRRKKEAEAREEPKEAVCPVCGTRHSALTGCPACALNGVTGGSPDPGPAKQKKSRKPPWEK